MKFQGRLRGKPSVREASRRLSGLVGRARRLDVDLRILTSVTLLRQACGAAGGGRLLKTASLLFLLTALSLLVLLLPCISPCGSSNSSKELHIETISWHHQPVEDRDSPPLKTPLSGDPKSAENSPSWARMEWER